MKRIALIGLVTLVGVAGYLAYTTVDPKTDTVVAAKKAETYSGKLYVAGMGGHFAVADVTIDPSNMEQPIKVNDLDRIEIGSGKTHPVHDARIDVNDRNVIFWSTYKLDPDGNLHVGKSDLKTGKVLVDLAEAKPERVNKDQAIANYCASGQSKDYFFPISMANEGYVDVRDKKTLELKHRIFMDQLGYKSATYTFAHGINTPDMKKFLITLNWTPGGFQGWMGQTRLYLVDTAELEKGKIKKLAEGKITGTPGKTITFRQTFTPDGKYLLQSGGDRAYLIDGNTLEALDEITEIRGDAHDLIGTPDSKYAVITMREKIKNAEGNEIEDGTLMLYDIEAKKVVGKNSISVCYACHEGMVEKTSALCGMDANWN